MKLSYFNIFLFSLPLIILINDQSNYNSPKHTSNSKNTKSHRSLCECDLYTSIYDNDPEMKFVMENFNRQTSERLKEYDERMQDKRNQCKEQCDKEIQKIVLKDKLEKELTQKISTLETNIDTNDMPTCVCKKSLADKTEKFCLNCGLGLGSGVLQASSLLGGIGQLWLDAWKTAALAAVTKDAITKGLAAGEAARIPAAIKAVISGLRIKFPIEKLRFGLFESFINERTYNKVQLLSDAINSQYKLQCSTFGNVADDSVCTFFQKLSLVPEDILGSSSGEVLITDAIKGKVTEVLAEATKVAEATSADVASKTTTTFTTEKTGLIEAGFNSSITSIYASIIAILIIVLIMVIIYLILRYRRKKKMKKKIQYIKLLTD
ncbi:rifin [Plasmodium sp. gorilla clade G1]|nr:rifin [Plasmodium sp. gorilla clade G1]